jgi:hypothetical protein
MPYSIVLLVQILVLTALTIGTIGDDYSYCPSCELSESLLLGCQLRSLSTPRNSSIRAELRNVTGTNLISFIDRPLTVFIANTSSAACLCPSGRTSLRECTICANNAALKYDELDAITRSSLYNASLESDLYSGDCEEFGYFYEPEQGGPTSTRKSLPTATPTKTPKVPGCDLCDVIFAQVEECNLLSVVTSPFPPETSITTNSSDGHSVRSVLFNRTAAECICTLPVLQRFPGCETCGIRLGQKVGGGMSRYEADCGTMGTIPALIWIGGVTGCQSQYRKRKYKRRNILDVTGRIEHRDLSWRCVGRRLYSVELYTSRFVRGIILHHPEYKLLLLHSSGIPYASRFILCFLSIQPSMIFSM